MADPIMKGCKEEVLSSYDCIPLDKFIEKLNDLKEDLSERGAINFYVEMETTNDGDRSNVVLSYQRPETEIEREERINEDNRKMFLVQKRRRENQRNEIKQLFMDGLITAAVYEKRMAAIPPG